MLSLLSSERDNDRASGLIDAAEDSVHQGHAGEVVNEPELAEITAILSHSQPSGSVDLGSRDLTTARQNGSCDPLTQPAMEHSSLNDAGSQTSISPAASTETARQTDKPIESLSRGLKRKSSKTLDKDNKDNKVVRSNSSTAVQQTKTKIKVGTDANGSTKKKIVGPPRTLEEPDASIIIQLFHGHDTCAPHLLLPGPSAAQFHPSSDLDSSVPSGPPRFALPNSAGLTARRLYQLGLQLEPAASRSSSASFTCHSCPLLSLSPGSNFSARSALSSPSPPSSPMRAMSPSSGSGEFPAHMEVAAWVQATEEAAHRGSPRAPRFSDPTKIASSSERSRRLAQTLPATASPFKMGPYVQNLCFGKKKRQVDDQVTVSFHILVIVSLAHTRILAES